MLNLRLIPIVIFAAACLLVVKTIGFVVSDGRERAELLAAIEDRLWPRIAALRESDDLLITGSADQPRPSGIQHPRAADYMSGPLPPPPAIPANVGGGQSPAERALIERLQERRQELEARERDLELRESLLKAAEKRLESRIEELRELENRERETPEQLKSIVVMYEAMRPRDAARIFDRLDSRVLVEVVNLMNPRRVSEIMAQMQPEAAERLTLDLARRRIEAAQSLPPSDLPRIEGTVK